MTRKAALDTDTLDTDRSKKHQDAWIYSIKLKVSNQSDTFQSHGDKV